MTKTDTIKADGRDFDEANFDECLYCGQEVKQSETVPPVDDDTAWEKLSQEHLDSCEWVLTRAHRLG